MSLNEDPITPVEAPVVVVEAAEPAIHPIVQVASGNTLPAVAEEPEPEPTITTAEVEADVVPENLAVVPSTYGALAVVKVNHHEEIKDVDDLLRERMALRTPRKRSKDSCFSKLHDDIATASSSSSNNDICRICHMGNSSSYQSCVGDAAEPGSTEAAAPADNSLQAVTPVGSRTSAPNLDLGRLVSACRCRGTVGLVHTKCLERWLTESGHTRCELCGYRYATIRVPRHGLLRSLLIWIKTFVATRQMLLDSLYLVVTTPLAVFSAYVCAMTLKMALENRIGDIPWTIVAMLPTCSLTLVAYWGWLLTLQRLHGRRWRQYWQNNFTVQLIPDSPVVQATNNNNATGSGTIEEEVAALREQYVEQDYYEDLPDIFNMI